ncbi:general transcription factor IIH subunit 2-like isoform X2 [Lethenteron reissneri]|uniref:general transcription factor IIH subunit 2-like isoform X2 n=1 Tax=Lethenteron reissneri TaxID=7753 RepID=UPI002AB7C285|nr:general transcription factor IIH subunit 2-like isoform X2 [Lethenteron reissneri]
MMEEEPERAKRWEGDYERTWEVLKEDESGSLKASVDDLIFQAKRRKVSEFHGQVRLGMLLEHFVEEYFYQNPISQVGLITTKNKRAEKLTELGGTPKKHITALKKATQSTCLGEPSLYNSLQLAMETLKHMPSHTSREILVVFGSLTTCDPANIYDLIQTLKAGKVRVSIIGLSAEVHVCTALTKETGGSYHVILDESHFKELLLYHVTPPPVSANMDSSLIRMGSWRVRRRRSQVLSVGGFFCPQCRAKYCELPVECKVCGLTLVSAPHLARSYHHLFPLDAFQEQPLDKFTGQRVCEGCQVQLKENSVFMCSLCARPFCLDCDLFIHETLHCCPGCVHSDKQNT